MKGARVYSNPEVMALKNAGYSPKNSLELSQLVDTIRATGQDTVSAIKGQPRIKIDRDNRKITERSGNYAKTYLNAKITGL